MTMSNKKRRDAINNLYKKILKGRKYAWEEEGYFQEWKTESLWWSVAHYRCYTDYGGGWSSALSQISTTLQICPFLFPSPCATYTYIDERMSVRARI